MQIHLFINNILIKEYLEKFEEINKIICRSEVYSGGFDEFSKSFGNSSKNHFTKRIDDVFLSLINKWRLELGIFLFNKDEKYKNTEILNDVIQEFINQIIFLRICEDRNLPTYKNLKETASNENQLKESLKRLFKEVDKQYNSKLFSGENIIFDLDNEIIFEIISALYYPQSPYLFNIIEPGILGKIYEVFLTEKLILENNEIKLQKKKEFENRSVVSTPTEIAKYMVKNVLEPICKDKTPDQILTLKIADIACGSGIFLEETFQYLTDYCIEWYQKNKPTHLIELSNGKKKLPLFEKKKILTNCIFGVDIDIHAVEVCKFSLLIKLIEDETEASVKECTPILPDLMDNIKNGNALISREDLKDDIDFNKLKLINPFDWNEINNGKKFSLIIGNPPYVKTEDMHKLETEDEFSVYKKKYKSAYKQFDKYFLFVEKALDLITDDGFVTYIIPNKFFKIESGQKIRDILKTKISKLDDFGSLQLFPDKTIYSCILTCKNKSDTFVFQEIESVISLWLNKNIKNAEIENKYLSDDIWLLSADKSTFNTINDMIKKSVSLENIVDIFNGIQTSAERPPIYWFSKNEVISENSNYVEIKKFNNNFKIEKELLKPYFKPTKKNEKGLNTYSILNTDKKIIFPYDKNGNLIDIKTMKSKYSETYKYFEFCYDELVPKCLNNGKGRDIKDATNETWYQYGRSQALTSFINTPKIIVRVLSKAPMYSFDDNDTFISSGGTAGYCAIKSKEKSKYHLFYIQAWLNSSYTEQFIKMIGSDFEGGFIARGTYLLKRLPFIELDFNDEKQKKIHDDVVELTKKINELNLLIEKSDKSSKIVFEKEKKSYVKKIDDLISKVYRLEFVGSGKDEIEKK